LIKYKGFIGAVIITLLFTGLTINLSKVAAAEETINDYTEEQLKENDYILYFVNAGDKTPDTVEGSDKMGLYSSKTEQMYGVDSGTGKTWGLVTETTNTTVIDGIETDKKHTLRYYNGPQTREKALEYKFELPEGEYDITLGFKNPWSGRSVNIFGEGDNLSNGDYDIGSYSTENEFTYRQLSVSDGELDLKVQGPKEAALTNHNDPLVNYIIIRKNVVLPLSDLETKILEAKAQTEETDIYTPVSLAALITVIEESEALVQAISEQNKDVTSKEVQDEIRAAINSLETALDGLVINVPNTSFKPGQPWLDTNGAVIQAHGGGIMYDEKTETYYWYGEDKTKGYLPATGVHAYSSKDLYNWKDEGVVMKAIENREDMDTDPYLVDLYGERTAEEKDVIFSDINTARGVLERPKVIYNEKTDKYVLWLHVDGPYEGSDSNYAKAKAGVAISDSPTGPFEYLESNRLNKVPDGMEYQVRNTGMSRDMTLFKDDDGTAYIIYSSEENYSLYISKLNEEYTAIAGEEYGKDFKRVIYNGHREAPAMFKYDGKYYLITSGATGWDPNPGRYHVADSVLGEWKDMGNPVIGEGASTTHGSQSTYVIPVDPENGKFIFMGDRWNRNDLGNSRYIWLPIEFGQEEEIVLNWYDEWNMEILNKMGKVTIHTEIPEKILVGETPSLPNVVNVTTPTKDTFDTEVSWSFNENDFSKLGTVIVEATFPELNDKVLLVEMEVVPPVDLGELELDTDVLLYGNEYSIATTITNNTDTTKEVTVSANVPTGWESDPVKVHVSSHETKEITIPVNPPLEDAPTILDVKVTASHHAGVIEKEIEIVAVPNPEDVTFAFDAGTSSSTVLGGYDKLSPDERWDSTKGYGWIGEVPDSRDRGVVDSLRKDLIASFNPATLGLAIPAGYHTVYVLSGDRQYSQANTKITVDGEMVAETDGTELGEFKVLSFVVNGGESGKKVDVQFSGESGKHWIFNALMVKKDTTAPTITTYANEEKVVDAVQLDDTESVTFTWQAEDTVSGVEKVAATFNGENYDQGTEIPLAGKPGDHELVVTAVDKNGNISEVSYMIHVTTSAANMASLVERFEKAGEFANHGSAESLLSHINSVDRFEQKGDRDKAIHHLNNFKKLLEHHKDHKLISVEAYDILCADVDYLLEKWQ